jgi:hypothetical protein
MSKRLCQLDQKCDLATEVCCTCNVDFAWPEPLRKAALDDHRRGFYCPNGHLQYFIGETTTAKACRERDMLRAQLDQERARTRELEKSASALRGQITKAKRRASNGVCPCCTRSFANLRRHMASKHPNYTKA